jgi:hypothetical protein
VTVAATEQLPQGVEGEFLVGGRPVDPWSTAQPACAHAVNFYQRVEAVMVKDERGVVTSWGVTLRIRCIECDAPFEFVGETTLSDGASKLSIEVRPAP